MDNGYIQNLNHSFDGKWHQYDFVLQGRYGWQYMIDSAEYAVKEDIIPLGTVTRADHPGGNETEILPAVKISGGAIAKCPETVKEGSMLAVGGNSIMLDTLIKTVWINQTNRLRIFTLRDKTEQIKDYAEKLIARKLSPSKKDRKAAYKKARKEERKEKYKSTPKEKRAGATALTVLGVIWTLGGFSMAAVLDDFFPYGFAWFAISISFTVLGVVIFRQSKKEETIPQEKLTMPVAVDMQAVNKNENRLWIAVNEFNPALPFIEGDNSISLFSDIQKMQEYIKQQAGYTLKVLSLDRRMTDKMKNIWQRYGIITIKLYENDGSCINQKCSEKNYIGSEIESTLLKIMQNKPMATLGQQSLYHMEKDSLRRLFADIPLLVPFRYDSDSEEAIKADRQIHMTEKACMQLSVLLKNDNGTPKEEIPVYYGIEQLRGKHTVTMWNGGRVIYYGGTEILSEVSGENEFSGSKSRIMHPMFADNRKTKMHMVAAFTNIADLREMYTQHRVALFSFSELAALAKEGDGIVVNPGIRGLCAVLDHETTEKLN